MIHHNDDDDCPRCHGKPVWGRVATIVVLEHADGSVRLLQSYGPDQDQELDPCSWAHCAAAFGARAITRVLNEMLDRQDPQDPEEQDTELRALLGLPAAHG